MSKDAEAVLIVHLTDLHIANKSSLAFARLGDIAGAIGARIDEPTVVVLAISGDVAYSGTSAEYEIAQEALDSLISQLQSWNPVDIVVVASPGNHDCDFKAMPSVVRDTLVASLSSASDGAESLVEALRPTQKAFSDFASRISGHRLIELSPMLSQLRIELPSLSIDFLTLNTSVSSSLRERPGALRVPVRSLPEVKRDATCCVLLAHHPLNWFEPQDAIALSEWIDRTADLILLGHEHRLDEFNQARVRTGSSVMYEIGLPLDDPDGGRVGFKCLRINGGSQEVVNFDVELNRGRFVATERATGMLHANEGRQRGNIRFSDGHKAFLGDAGAAFTHPRLSREVQLSDLFVPPDFREVRADKVDSERLDGSISLDEICKSIVKPNSKAVVFGAEQSGKTAFSKYLIGWARARGVVPIYLDAMSLRSINRGEVRGWFNSALSNQFAEDCREAVEQTPPESTLVVLDNVHAVRGGADGIEQVLDFVSTKSSRLLLLTADSPALSALASGASGEERAYWRGGSLFEILPLGHKRRGELIRRWVSLGRNGVEESSAIESEVRQVKVLLDRMLGKDSLPKFPLFILIILQQLEGVREGRTVVANGSHGYLFEAMISQSIDRHVRSHEIGTVNDFLASVAFQVWERDVSGLSESAVSDVIQNFLNELVRIDRDKLLEELAAARILTKEYGLYRFRYNYVYFYYLAKWICAKPSGSESDVLLDRLIELVHTEMSSNVLMFVAHLKQEWRVVGRLIPLVNGLFPEQADSLKTLEAYSPLSLRFRTAEQKAILLEGAAREVSDEVHAKEDMAPESSSGRGRSEDVQDAFKFNTTMKAMHTLGQVLKSRATSVDAQMKVEISEAIIGVSRRLMGFLYKVTGDNAEDIVLAASDAFEKAFKLSRQQAVDVANALIGMVVAGTARICVTRAAEAIGSPELIPLIDHLGKNLADEDSRLILLVARITGEREFPKEDVEDFVASLKPANVLPQAVLAHATARRFYLDPPERGIRDSACKLLGINVRKLPSPVRRG